MTPCSAVEFTDSWRTLVQLAYIEYEFSRFLRNVYSFIPNSRPRKLQSSNLPIIFHSYYFIFFHTYLLLNCVYKC